jgi:hypothetical protein
VDALTDEILMVYADGALDDETRAWIEAQLLNDSDARRRVEIFRATGTRISPLFGGPMQEPPPPRLVDFVLQFNTYSASPARPKRAREIFTAWREKLMSRGTWEPVFSPAAWRERLPESVTWQVMASAAGLIAAAGAGWILHSSGGPGADQLTAFRNGKIYAEGALAYVLESKPSNRPSRVDGGAQDSTVVRAILTFKSKGGGFCREYETETAKGKRFAGLACREPGGEWAIEVHVAEADAAHNAGAGPTAGRGDGGGPHEEALDPIVDNMISGIAFGKEEENAAIDSGWK